MDKLQKQVGIAQRRLVLQSFAERLVWCMLTTFCIAAVAIVVPKIWFVEIEQNVWISAWLGGAAGVGLLSACVWSYLVRKNSLEAAIELDLRYGLRERVSSSLSLDHTEAETEAGQALMKDAIRRVERIDVAEKFPVKTNWKSLLPIGAAGIAFLLAVLLPNATLEPNPNAANASTLDRNKKVIKTTTEELKKQLAERSKKAEEKGLKEASDLFKKLQESAEKMDKKNSSDQKKTLVELNDLAKQLKERRQSLSNSKDFKEKLNAMKNISKGPGDKLAKAMREGDLRKAMDEMKNLQKQMTNNQMSAEQKQQLANQLAEMQKKMQNMVDAHEKAKQDLKAEIEKAKQAGDEAAAKKMQQQLDQLQAQNEQMNRMQQMANQLGKANQQMKKGNMQQAADQLAQMANDLQDLQQQLDELEMLDEAMDQMASAREAMCKACQMGQMPGMGQMSGNGNGLGDGQGQGNRPEEESDTGFYDSQVRADPKKGKGVIVDYVKGKGMAGQTLVEIKDAMAAKGSIDDSALTEKRLSKDHQKNAQQYFDLIREGK